MYEQDNIDLADDQPKKRNWTLKKMPIKGGSVLRGAVLSENDKHTPEWMQVEGKTDA